MRSLLVPLLLGLALAPSARAEPFAGADAKAGEALVKKADCLACHIRMVGGDGTALFTRADRKVKSAQALLTQVRTCNTQLNSGWFPEDEENVAKYLNQKYYHFK